MLNHVGTKTIETERMILRSFHYLDNAAMLRNWVGDESLQAMYSEPAYKTEEEVNELLRTYINSYEKPDYYRWAVVLKENGECIGQIAFFLVDNKNNFCELEYCIGSKFQNRGLATEAAQAVIDFAFKEVDFHKVQICHRDNNSASKAVIKKCGFKYEGALRDFFYAGGSYEDRLYYSILKEEWEKQKNLAANKFYFVNGSVELLDLVEPMWYKLNRHHEEMSKYFKERYRNFKFENRKHKLLLGDMLINIDLIKKDKIYVGYCISSINKEHIGEIESLFIEEEYRKYGLGDSIMKRALKWLEEKGAKSKMIGVAEGNEEVLEFYKKYGFYKRTIILQEK